jgi:hypothetical protein
MTPQELQAVAADAFSEYSKVWGKPERQEYIVVTRAIEATVKAIHERTKVDD